MKWNGMVWCTRRIWILGRERFILSKSVRVAIKKNKVLGKRLLKPGSQISCKMQCVKNLEESRRVEIHKQFWTLSNNDQKKFLFNCITNTNTKRKRVKGNSRRKKKLMIRLLEMFSRDMHRCYYCQTWQTLFKWQQRNGSRDNNSTHIKLWSSNSTL